MIPSQFLCLSCQKVIIFLFLSISFSHGDDEPLSSIIKRSAFERVGDRRSGVEYKVPLPANLDGAEASALKISSRAFWLNGASLSLFRFPPGILSFEDSGMLLLVNYNLGLNLSASLYGRITGGYSLASPVVGLAAYDAWNMSSGELGFEASVYLIKVELPPAAANSSARHCARFGDAGEFSLEGEEVNGRCSTKGPGRFGVVVSHLRVQLPAAARKARKRRAWEAVGAGVFALLCGAWLWVLVLGRRNTAMEMGKGAGQEEALEVVWVGGSKMPSAGLVRTQPLMVT